MDKFNEILNTSINFKAEFIYSLVIIVIITIIKWALNRLIYHKVDDIATSYRWRKISTYLAVIVGIILIIPIWFQGFKSMATFFGLFTAGVAIALKDPLSSIVGWLFILWKRPFSTGDRIEIDKTAGDVIDIRLFQFSLIEIGQWVDADQSTGRVVHIPNSKVLNSRIANYTAGFAFIWNEIPVVITFESNWEMAKEILLQIANEHTGEFSKTARDKIRRAARKYLIYYGKLTPIVYTTVKESGVLLTIRYLTAPQQRRTTEAIIWEDILKRFRQEDEIEFAYPTRRLYLSDQQQAGDGKKTEEQNKTSYEMDGDKE